MQRFGYYDPTSVQKAVGIAADKPEAKYLAGGQSLIATMKLGLSAPTDARAPLIASASGPHRSQS